MEIRRDKYLDLLIHSCGDGLIKVIAGTLRNSAFQKKCWSVIPTWLNIKSKVKSIELAIGVKQYKQYVRNQRSICH